MRSSDLFQVVIDPKEFTREMMDAAQEAASKTPLQVSTATTIRVWLADYVHAIGIHHWVHYRTFDMGSKRFISHPGIWICSLCSKGQVSR
jgi:hypothetical protein